MLFNRDNNGADELRELTGSYYANNDFSRIAIDVKLAEEEMRNLVGQEVMERAQAWYDSLGGSGSGGLGGSESEIETELLEHLRIPIALNATFRYYQTNLVSHEDTGRKVKIDNENEKLPWEWMLDRDDAAQLRKYHETTDRLIRFLEAEQVEEWISSPKRLLTRKLFVNTEALFQDAYPLIDSSPRFFYTITPFNREIQERQIRKALGIYYTPLLEYWQAFNVVEGSGSGSTGLYAGIPAEEETDTFMEELLKLVQAVIPLLVMITAAKRLSLQVLPYGVVQHLKSMMQTANASQAALPEIIRMYCSTLQSDAGYMLDDIKRLLQSQDPDANTYRLEPKNDSRNKFFRL